MAIIKYHPGRRLDKVIANKVLKLNTYRRKGEGDDGWMVVDTNGSKHPLPLFSTDIDDSHLVIKAMQREGYIMKCQTNYQMVPQEYHVCFVSSGNNTGKQFASTKLPYSICMAALVNKVEVIK